MNGFRRVALFFLFLTSLSVYATTLSESDAWNVARQFMQLRNTTKLRSTTMPQRVNLDPAVSSPTSLNPALFVFNIGDDQGFVIVSGETGTMSILGYSDEGQIQAAHLPDNLKAWLNKYDQEIRSLRAGSFEAKDTNSQYPIDLRDVTPIVPPLLGLNRWTQLHPYNLSCPWDYILNARSSVGCVALAMGQIMHFHKWPPKPKGKLSYYVDNMGLQTMNFDAQTYDWSRMSKPIDQSQPAHQDTLLANLLFHCGLSLRMQYSANGSAADAADVGSALVHYFDYDSNIQYYKREHYSNEAWESMLRLELNEARPVLYAAFSQTAGHVFVCDGYDSNNLFHINWGWGGNGNGYFELGSLNPNAPNAVGAADGFNRDQSMLVRIQKPDQQNRVTYSLGMYAGNLKGQTDIFSKNDLYSMHYECKNYGTNTFVGFLGLGYYDSNYQLKLLENTATSQLTLPSGSIKSYDQYRLSLPSNFSEGMYRIFAVYRPNDSIRWTIIPGLSAVQLQITKEWAKFTYGNSTKKQELKSPINILHPVYQDQSAEVYVTFMNYDLAFKSTLMLDLYSLPDNKFVKTIYQRSHELQAGTTQTLQLKTKMTCPPGNYNLVVRSSSSYSPNFIAKMEPVWCNNLSVQVKPLPSPSDLNVIDSMHLQQTLSQQASVFSLKAKIANYGGFANTTLAGLVYPQDGETCLDTLSSTDIYLDTMEMSTLNLNGRLSLRDGFYKLILCQESDNGFVPLQPIERSCIPFTIGNPLATTDSLTLYWHLNDDRLILEGDHPVNEIRLYDCSGILRLKVNDQACLPVGTLAKGLYILKVRRGRNVLMDKFLRR